MPSCPTRVGLELIENRTLTLIVINNVDIQHPCIQHTEFLAYTTVTPLLLIVINTVILVLHHLSRIIRLHHQASPLRPYKSVTRPFRKASFPSMMPLSGIGSSTTHAFQEACEPLIRG